MNLINEIRKLIASYLIKWTFDILPDDNEYKLRFARFNEKNIDQL